MSRLPKLTLNKRVTTILLSLFLFAAAGFTVYVSLSAAKPNYPVVVAAKDLTVGQQLKEDDMTVKLVPQIVIPEEAVTSTGWASGKVLTGGPVFKGEILVKKHLSADSSLVAALNTFAPAGWVAAELPEGTGMSMTGIKRGDKVDVYSGVPSVTPDGKPGSVSGLVVEGAIVLTVPEQGGKGAAKSYVIAVPPEAAGKIAELEIHNKKSSIVLKKGA
ncbi:MAG: hypothetical protein K6U74_04530 [Firmicutes bacterium]|nr:hypothetical protein [Bacillota bacterium]